MPVVDPRPFLAAVEKPARYIDHEINAIRKPFTPDRIHFCLAFPDAYEVGVSHLGLKILYRILNDLPEAACDRSYAPWPDFARALRDAGAPLFAWESCKPLTEFDVLGFTLQSELTYTNILEMLDLARIPLHAAERGDEHPLVIAGGPCACNPEPLADFFDAILIGEGEDAIADLARALLPLRKAPRAQRLAAIAEIPGFYAPQLHDPRTAHIVARRYMDFTTPHRHYRDQLIPWLQATHDRYGAEIMRGCSRGCRFCQAGFFYRPVRERPPQQILDELTDEVVSTGWEEVGLLSLSSSDYTHILPLMQCVLAGLDNTLLSLPSLRVDTLNDEMIGVLRQIGQTGLTIAPEAGSQRLRDAINKNLSEEAILEGVDIALRNGWRLIKLYFMLGLPGETMEDVDGIAELIETIQRRSGKRIQMNITLSPFTPKAFTPFQWAAMDDRETLKTKVFRIRNRLNRYRNLKIRYHSLETSLLEAIVGRGDRSIGGLVETAWLRGAKFDGWSEWARPEIWEEIWRENPDAAQVGAISPDAPLPWDHIDLGVSKDFLRTELDKAQRTESTPDCRESACTGCGVCRDDVHTVFAPSDLNPPARGSDPLDEQAVPYRVHYRKHAALAYVSHLDFLRNVMRFFRASGLPVAHSQGFKPHPRVSLSPPLPVGVEGWNEFIDVFLTSQVPPAEILRRLKFPGGLELLSVEEWLPKEMRDLSRYVYESVVVVPPPELREVFTQGSETFARAESIPFERERKGKVHNADLKELIPRLEWDGETLFAVKRLQGVNVFEILETLYGLERNRSGGCRVVRVALGERWEEMKRIPV
jgi:radical SAM family uncharacterized protein/radical SAM-linked protein